MSVIDRIKERRVVSPVVEVPLDLKGGRIVFKIARFSQLEREKARKVLRKECRDEGLDPGALSSSAQTIAYLAVFGDMLKGHCRGWTAEGIDLPFTTENLAMVWDELSEEEKVLLGAGYFAECESDETKKKGFATLKESFARLYSIASDMSAPSPSGKPAEVVGEQSQPET